MSEPIPDEKPEPDAVLWWTFRHQTWLGHALVVLGGFAVWMSAYALHLSVVGGDVALAAAGGPDALAARQAGIRAASVACWLWFSLAFTVGKGGPLLDVTLYPTGALLFGPYLTALVVVGRLPSEMYTAAGPTSALFVADGVGIFLPGVLLSLAVLGAFLGVKTYVLGTHEAWADKHLPEPYHEYRAEFDAWERSR